MDPLAGSAWRAPETVAGFVQSPPNAVLLQFAEQERQRGRNGWALDLGCGAGRNAIPLTTLGWNVLGLDLSWPMLRAAAPHAEEDRGGGRLSLVFAPMDQIPARNRSFELLVAHGIWNLAHSAAEFRRALRETSRVAKPGAGLFVFTFSRNTFPSEVEPVAGEPFVFTQFSGQPQCFLTESQLVSELGSVGFAPDLSVPITEYNRPRPGTLRTGRTPVIFEAAFRYTGATGQATPVETRTTVE